MDDEGHGRLQQNVEVTCNDLAGEKIDEVLKYIKNTQENSEDIFEASNDVVKNRIEFLVFQYIRKHFNVKNASEILNVPSFFYSRNRIVRNYFRKTFCVK